MKTGKMGKPTLAAACVLACAFGIAGGQVADSSVQLRGAAWMQVGRIEHSSDRVSNGSDNNFNKNWQEGAGVQLGALTRVSPNWEGALGLGVSVGHAARGGITVANNWYPTWSTFVSEARVTYADTVGRTRLQVALGYFPYSYSPENRNLGLYLLRGIVYPGTVTGGFEARQISGSSIFGGMFRAGRGTLQNDLILMSETDHRPYFDLSLADVVTWQALPSLQLGAGVNFYRALPRVPAPGKDCDDLYSNYTQVDPSTASGNNCVIMDSVGVDSNNVTVYDTITGGLQGTKAMARFRFDPKVAFGMKGIGPLAFGKQDLVLYGEAALLGFKNYPKYYEKRSERMPVMAGLNLPAFGYLDRFTLEVEYYGSKNYSDYGKTETYSSWIPRTVAANTARDDWKWSLYASRVVLGNLRISGQVANDHLRTFGAPDLGYTTYAEALSTPRDWYWMAKLTYFF